MNQKKKVSEAEHWVYRVDPPPDTPEGRAAGRQRKRGQASYFKILAEAKRVFAQQGYHGTTVRDITSAAEVNVGAVTYHFGSKQELYKQVLRGFTGRAAMMAELIAKKDRPALERIEGLVRFFFDHIRIHPEMVPLMVRELASGEALAEPIQAMMARALPAIAGIIAAGQKDGSIRPGDPMLLALSSLAQPVYLNLARKGIAAAAGLDPNDPTIFNRVVDHCVTTVRAALENRP